MKTFVPFVLLCVVVGCGKTYTITGQVTCGGEPIQWQTDKRDLLILFGPTDRKSNPKVYRAESDTSTSKFTVSGIPAGEYVVAVHVFDPAPKHCRLNLKYDLGKSPLRHVVSKDEDIKLELPGLAPAVAEDEK